LGFNIRQFKTRTRKSGWKLLIRPSKESVKKIREKLRTKWRSLRGREVSIVLKELNPIIRGWANYFRIGVSYRTFSALDHWMVHKAIRYAKRTHPTKPKYWWQAKYFGQLNNKRKDRWVFGDKRAGAYLLMFKWHKIERHILVKGKATPDDPELREYWEHRRMMKVKDLTPSRQKIAKAQNCVCPICDDWLFNEEELHSHHKKPKSEGGGNRYDNLILVHLYCHQQIHSD
jgi:RNA-directed DNA polymerase